MTAIEEMIKNARLHELMRYRQPQNEYDSALEIVRPELQSSKRYAVNEEGQLVLYPTEYSELITKDAATANFGDFDGPIAENWSKLSLLCQFIAEASNNKIDLTEAQRFDALQAGIRQQYSKAKDGAYAKLLRTMRAENISTQTTYGEESEKKKGLRLLPSNQ